MRARTRATEQDEQDRNINTNIRIKPLQMFHKRVIMRVRHYFSELENCMDTQCQKFSKVLNYNTFMNRVHETPPHKRFY